MKKQFLIILLLFTSFLFSFAQSSEVYFSAHPTLSPDAQTIIFSYDGNLWKVPSNGGMASQLTSMQGAESLARISPDGKWLVFSASPYGNLDLFAMPMAGGSIQQLTFHQANDRVSNWAWDNETIYFTSDRENRMSTYSIKVSGGTPKRIFPHYFNNIHNLAANIKTGDLFFNESWESDFFAHRKGYKGAYNPDIKSYNPKTKAYKQLTNYEGKDFYVTTDKTGAIYFLSDELNGVYNLYTFNGGKKEALTKFESAIYRPFVSANGEKIVFQKDYQLFMYDVKSKKSTKVAIALPKNNVLEKTKDFNVSGNITAFDIASDNKKMAFVSRGELFVSDIKGKFPKQLKTAANGRVMEVKWLKDDKTLLFNQTIDGYQNWFKIAANGKGKAEKLTSDQQNNRNLVFNSDKSKAVYLSGRNEVRLMDLASFESQLLFKEELWGFYNSDPQFAADDKHILLSAYRNFETDLFVYNLDTKIKQNLTQTGVSEAGPIWSPDGKYIYYNSNPTRPSYPYGMRNANLYRLPLEKIDSPFKSDEFDKLFEEEKEDKEEKETEKDADKEKEEKEEKEDKEAEKEKIIVQIDADQIMERSEQFAPSFGSQFTLSSIKGEDKEIVLFSSNHEGGDYALYKWEKEAFKKGETKKIAGAKGGSYGFASSDGKYYILNRGNIHTLDIKGNKLTKIDISLKFRRQLRAEFEQMYYETWANVEENFYDENFHGVNWTGLRDQYAQYLPFINNRADLRSLLNDLLGELNTSHFGFYSSGAEESNYYGSTTLSTGIQFRTDQPYIVDRIIQRSPADKKGKDILPGDELVAINGQALDKQQNRNFYFTKPSMDEEVELTFKRMGKEIKTKLHPISYFTQRNLLYDEWMAERQAIVDTKSNKKIAYVHMKNMGGGQLNHFLKQMVSEAHHRDALILDLRYNTGGNVHDEVLKFLSQKPYLQWKYREGALTPQSNFIPGAKPIVLLINEQSLSDAEMTATGFKALKLGTIMGTETYRWIIFTSGKGLVDGSFYRLPSWGCYTLDGKNIEKTGVAPDIVIKNTFKDRLEGKDPQLDRAIGHILKELQ